jgi:glycine cleavage system H protein
MAVNDEVTDNPELVNTDPYGAWLYQLRPFDPSSFENLLDHVRYRARIGE